MNADAARRRENLARQALRGACLKTEAGGRRIAAQRRQRRPTAHLAVIWREVFLDRYGYDFPLPEWKVKEKTLAKRLHKEMGLDLAEQIVTEFIKTWKGTMLPTMGMCYKDRANVVARIRGEIKSKADRINESEFNEQDAGEDQSDW